MKLFISLGFFIASASAFAFPQAPAQSLEFSPIHDLQSLDFDAYEFEGIVKLSNCSGSLVKFEGQPDTSTAIVMTNGHCISSGFLQPGEVRVNQVATRSMTLFKNLTTKFNISATKIAYATMTNTDITLYELSETYAQIAQRTGVTPLILSNVRPEEQTEIEIISGFWERGYSCAVDGFVYKLKEGSWTFTDSVRYAPGCDTIGGTSGSPIVEKGTRVVVAINNTGNESGERCTVNNPCEVNEKGEVAVHQGVNYGQQIYQIYTCLNQNFKIDLSISGCLLPK